LNLYPKAKTGYNTSMTQGINSLSTSLLAAAAAVLLAMPAMAQRTLESPGALAPSSAPAGRVRAVRPSAKPPSPATNDLNQQKRATELSETLQRTNRAQREYQQGSSQRGNTSYYPPTQYPGPGTPLPPQGSYFYQNPYYGYGYGPNGYGYGYQPYGNTYYPTPYNGGYNNSQSGPSNPGNTPYKGY